MKIPLQRLPESPYLANHRCVPMQAIGRYLPPSAVLDVLAEQHGFHPTSAPLATHLVKIFKEAASNRSKRMCGDLVSFY